MPEFNNQIQESFNTHIQESFNTHIQESSNTQIQETSTQIQMESSLPDQLIHQEIFPRLRVKDLMKMKCCSKATKALICSPNFGINHYCKCPYMETNELMVVGDYTGVFVTNLQEEDSKSELVFPPEKDRSFIIEGVLGCVNGVACFLGFDDEQLDHLIAALNITTKKYRKFDVPKTPCSSSFGFGFDQSTSDFVLVHVVDDDDELSRNLEYMYFKSDSTNPWKNDSADSWKTGPKCSCVGDLPVNFNGVFHRGKIFWLVVSKTSLIVSYDLSTKEWSRNPIRGPVAMDEGCVKWFGKFDRRLCLVTKRNSPRMDYVWVRKERSWTVLFAYGDVIGRDVHPIIPVLAGSRGVLVSIRFGAVLQLCWFDPKNGTIEVANVAGVQDVFFAEPINRTLLDIGGAAVGDIQTPRQGDRPRVQQKTLSNLVFSCP